MPQEEAERDIPGLLTTDHIIHRQEEESAPWPVLPEDEETQVAQDLLCLQEAAWELFENYENKLHTTSFTAGLQRERLSETFYHLHQYLLKEEEALLAKQKKRVEEANMDLESRVLPLSALSTSFTEMLVKLEKGELITKTVEQLRVFNAQLQALSKVKVTLDRPMSPFQIQEWRGIRHIVKPVQKSLCFDPDSAHPNLLLSENLKQVRYTATPQPIKTKNFFAPGLYLLGLPEFQSGQHYWEVDVGHKSNWIIGVVKASVKRKEAQDLCPKNGFWVLRKQHDYVYYGCGLSAPKLITSPMRIGVFVDVVGDYLAFYDGDTTGLMFEMSGCAFVERLYAFFCPGVPVREEDVGPLTLCQ